MPDLRAGPGLHRDTVPPANARRCPSGAREEPRTTTPLRLGGWIDATGDWIGGSTRSTREEVEITRALGAGEAPRLREAYEKCDV
jgi:hypothetical protein